jgi:hypothetical protein
MKLFVPTYGNYYHFITESAMGLYRELQDNDGLDSKDCELWYKGPYRNIVQLFSCHPLHIVENIDQIHKDIRTLVHVRPKCLEQWLELIPLRDYLQGMFVSRRQEAGITVIKRIGKREYAEHSELVEELKRFDLPVREAVLESLSFEEQIQLMRGTTLLIGPHGAGETNMMFMSPGSKIVELYPKGFSDRVFPAMATAFGHRLIEIESTVPSILGRQPSMKVQMYLESNPWPTREVFAEWRPDRMELGRVLRDVASFSIRPKIVVNQVEEMLCHR